MTKAVLTYKSDEIKTVVIDATNIRHIVPKSVGAEVTYVNEKGRDMIIYVKSIEYRDL